MINATIDKIVLWIFIWALLPIIGTLLLLKVLIVDLPLQRRRAKIIRQAGNE